MQRISCYYYKWYKLLSLCYATLEVSIWKALKNILRSFPLWQVKDDTVSPHLHSANMKLDQRGCVAQGCRVWPSPAWCFIYQNPMLPSTTDLPIPETTYYWTLGKQFILILPPGVSLSFGCGFSLSVEICFKYPSCSFHWCSAKSFGMSSFAFLFTRLSLPSD